ncbi:hypothetical protein ACLFKT_13540, partial [Paraburkholderia sp. BR14261]
MDQVGGKGGTPVGIARNAPSDKKTNVGNPAPEPLDGNADIKKFVPAHQINAANEVRIDEYEVTGREAQIIAMRD